MANKETNLSSLPDEMVIDFLAHISISYYPKLSLVSKRFNSLILSRELLFARYHLKTREHILQILTNDMEEDKSTTRNTLLVPIPSSYSPYVTDLSMGMVGSKQYIVKDYNIPPTPLPMWVRNQNESTHAWREAPRMKVARDNPMVAILDGKIYVVGGCKADETTNWAEVFDTNTQTWESLPDPGAELRSSLLKSTKVTDGKVYVRSNAKNEYYYYDPKEGKWGVVTEALQFERACLIENVWYYCGEEYFSWFDTKLQKWKMVKGLEVLNRNCCAGALAFEECENKNIWCSVITLERGGGGDDVWGHVEWASVVRIVPSSYIFLRCRQVWA
ncbi:BnaA06g11770D [Brassica napus]|uniref:BnaA06g11770D protein n=1 Tax=Brassica napus TaxID=3708 RepID=A0A078GIE3_BRANA|nr:BnaA06g11770D [Brassica napus]